MSAKSTLAIRLFESEVGVIAWSAAGHGIIAYGRSHDASSDMRVLVGPACIGDHIVGTHDE